LQPRQVFARVVGEVVRGWLDRVEAERGSQIDKVLERHRRLGLDLQVEILAVTVGGDAEAQVRLAGAADRLDGAPACGEDQPGAGSEARLEEVAAFHGGGLRCGKRERVVAIIAQAETGSRTVSPGHGLPLRK